MRSLQFCRQGCAGFAALILAGCATAPEPKIVVKEVKVPTPVACVPKDFPEPKSYPDTADRLKAAPSAAERYQLLAAGRILRDQRLQEVEPLIKGCR